MREQIRLWLYDIAWRVSNETGQPLSWTYNRLADLVNWIGSFRGWAYAIIDWALDQLPGILRPVGEAFTGWLKGNIVSPVFDTLDRVARLPLDALDVLWHAGRGWWYPSVVLEDRLRDVAEAILWVYDQSATIGGEVYEWIAQQVNTVVYWVDRRVADILAVLEPIEAQVSSWSWYDIPGTYWRALATADALSSLLNQLAPLLVDPAGWIWQRLESQVLERARRLLLAVW